MYLHTILTSSQTLVLKFALEHMRELLLPQQIVKTLQIHMSTNEMLDVELGARFYNSEYKSHEFFKIV